MARVNVRSHRASPWGPRKQASSYSSTGRYAGLTNPQKEKLPSNFQCLFCNHENSVSITLEKKQGVGNLHCKVCGQTFQTGINCTRPTRIHATYIQWKCVGLRTQANFMLQISQLQWMSTRIGLMLVMLLQRIQPKPQGQEIHIGAVVRRQELQWAGQEVGIQEGMIS